MKFATLAVSILLLAAVGAHADDTSSGSSKQKSQKDIDEEITNARLRAETGSKSKWSFASNIIYSGGPLTNPFTTVRPQLNEGQAAADPTNLQGLLSIKYRATQHDNLNLGIGLQYTPSFTSNAGNVQASSVSAGTPYLVYSHVFAAGGVQHVLSAQFSKYTLSTDVADSKLFGELLLSDESMAKINNSRLSLGAYAFIAQEYYSLGADIPAGATQYQFGFQPVAEYELSDKISLRTVNRWLTYTVTTGHPNKAIFAQPTESLGVGFSLTRDFYLYPNFQWMWSQMNWNKTTLGIQAFINI